MQIKCVQDAVFAYIWCFNMLMKSCEKPADFESSFVQKFFSACALKSFCFLEKR